VFIVYLYPCAARCAYSINEIDPLSEYGVVEMPLLRCKNTSTLEVSYRRAALPLDDFFPTERDTFTHIFTYGFGFQFPKVEVSSFKNLVETDRKKDERTNTTDRITFPANAVSKKILTVRKVVSIQYRRASNGTGLQRVHAIPARFSDESNSV